MADKIAYEREVSAGDAELWRVETELKTAFGPLPKTWYVTSYDAAIRIIQYAADQGGRLTGLTYYVVGPVTFDNLYRSPPELSRGDYPDG